MKASSEGFELGLYYERFGLILVEDLVEDDGHETLNVGIHQRLEEPAQMLHAVRTKTYCPRIVREPGSLQALGLVEETDGGFGERDELKPRLRAGS